MFQDLTRFIEKFQKTNHGEWVIDRDSKGNLIQMPYVKYSDDVSEFIHAIYEFQDRHPEFNMREYRQIIERADIKWTTESMEGAIVEDLDADTMMALIIGAVRADRFCEGALLRFIESGVMVRWLERLKELEE